ncbi:uncharacterized protein PFB0145c-like isoform X2 [Centruroides sculpturatus]|uniref:uncharacterized protein PFB0145c-like isoform X2 n=1 Tax=Centruroides sculpturatus TaxID=218467 RepID=UPI000C6D5025|nr:uncharacterized protein PFB0145c-like isoform X2 [Centruroides sculpturatus]
MASLPQGWHGMLNVPKKSDHVQAPKISHMTYQTLPAIKTLPNKKNYVSNIKSPSVILNGTMKIDHRSNVTHSLPNHTSFPLRTVRMKTENVELNNIKKELSKVKEENNILRCRLRKVDDENGRKTREIEKLHAEIKNMMEKKKESLNKISTNFRFSLKNKQNENEVKPSQINGKTNWKEKTLNSEILRLKDIINKLQEGNKKLMNQLKEKDQEIKSLRLQLAKAPGRNLLNRLQTKNEGEVKSTRDTVRNRPQNISNIKLEKIRPVVTNNLKGK